MTEGYFGSFARSSVLRILRFMSKKKAKKRERTSRRLADPKTSKLPMSPSSLGKLATDEIDRIYEHTEFFDVVETMYDNANDALSRWIKEGKPAGIGALIYTTFDISPPRFKPATVVKSFDLFDLEAKILFMKEEDLSELAGERVFDLAIEAAMEMKLGIRFPIVGYWSETYAPIFGYKETYDSAIEADLR